MPRSHNPSFVRTLDAAMTLCTRKIENMIILEIIAEFVIEVVFIEIIGGTMSRLNNGVLKLRGIETKSIEEIKFDKLKKRYEYKSIMLKSNYNEFKKGSKGVVLELIDKENALVEFKDYDLKVKKIEIKDLLIHK